MLAGPKIPKQKEGTIAFELNGICVKRETVFGKSKTYIIIFCVLCYLNV